MRDKDYKIQMGSLLIVEQKLKNQKLRAEINLLEQECKTMDKWI